MRNRIISNLRDNRVFDSALGIMTVGTAIVATLATAGFIPLTILVEVANTEILEIQSLMKSADPTSVDFSELAKTLDEAIDFRIEIGQAAFIIGSIAAVCAAVSLVNILNLEKRAKAGDISTPTTPMVVAGFMILGGAAGATAAEIVLNEYFLDTVKQGLLENHELFNSVFLGPVVPIAAVVVSGVVVAAIAGLIALGITHLVGASNDDHGERNHHGGEYDVDNRGHQGGV